ncbi:MAG: amino acid ABC transporter substrate-binding protein [Telmatospirillum sp.]|nr:amino acid ABC transporter substrate-binding protein [Telmatospirillum sp.]
MKPFLGILLLFQTVWMAPAEARTLKIYTIDAPPLTLDQPERHGLVGDILLEAVRRAGFQPELLVLPWRRAQAEVSTGEDLVIIPLSRTAERENAFNWIAPVFDLERTFATLGPPIDSVDQAKREHKIVLVGMGSAQETYLAEAGFDRSQTIVQKIGNSEIEMLKSGQADAWFNSTAETLWKWRRAGETAKLTFGKPVTRDTIYVACSKRCSKDISGPLAREIEAMTRDGITRRIIDSYLVR